MRRYSTIVVDPPWPMPETAKRTLAIGDAAGIHYAKSGKLVDPEWRSRSNGKTVKLPYDVMTLAEIAALPVNELADISAHLYLWTTNRFLEDAYGVARGWGFRPAQLLTWCKPTMGIGFGGAFTTTTEFFLFCRRGTLATLCREDSSWWKWSRPYENGHIAHSAKPEAFLDMVERVSPAPRLELFARRNRLGWDTWGNEALDHIEMEGANK